MVVSHRIVFINTSINLAGSAWILSQFFVKILINLTHLITGFWHNRWACMAFLFCQGVLPLHQSNDIY